MAHSPAPHDVLRSFDDHDWAEGSATHLEHLVEGGHVLHFPALAFVLRPGEERFLDPAWSDGRAKNISLRSGRLRGARGDAAELAELAAMIARYAEQAQALV